MHQTGIALQPGRWAVNFYPGRRWIYASSPYITLIELPFEVMYVPAWFPGAGFQRWARDAKAAFYNLTREPFYHVKKSLVSASFCCCLQCNANDVATFSLKEMHLYHSYVMPWRLLGRQRRKKTL